ncbi:MAG: hypothetical protein GY830_09845 [Bacteroidetes bacterium]|nr:hypothetical protein [Bacteroidota bacterium]
MTVKELWTNEDFDVMGWHDSIIYAIRFPDTKLEFILDIDYIFKWEKKKDSFMFWVSPCHLVFEGVLNLRMNLNFADEVGIDISSIHRGNKTLLTRNLYNWEYHIETVHGDIKFESTGYKQHVLSQPTYSNSQCLYLPERDFKYKYNHE